MHLKTLKTLGKLFVDYQKTPEETITDFITKSNLILEDPELDLFLDLIKHERLLNALSTHFIEKPLLSRIDRKHAQLAIYVILFVLNEDNISALIDFFLHLKCFYLCDLLASMTDPGNHLTLCQVSTEHFDDAYVLERIVDPFLNKIDLMVALGKRYLMIHEVKTPPVTKVHTFQCAQEGKRSSPNPPANTPLGGRTRFRAEGVPATTWRPSRGMGKALEKSKQTNKQRARALLAQANSMPSRLTALPPPPPEEPPSKDTFKSKPPPPARSISIKTNLTATLREASRVLKLQGEEARHVEELIRGGFDNREELQEQLKREREAEELEAIQKKHLRGLLSYEEAILAKKQLLERNREKMEEYKQERLELLELLDQWRRQEQEKIQTLVLKSHAIKQGARASELKLLEKNKQNVKEQQEKTKEMLKKALTEKNKELQKKVELIQEIRAINRVRFNLKEFDPTESGNLGLLCEMSIAELQERLAITKMTVKKELEEKRCGIARRREEHRQMVENVRRIVEENRGRKEQQRGRGKSEVRVEESAGVAELRRRLEEKRRLRSHLK